MTTTKWKDVRNKKLSPEAQARVSDRVIAAIEQLPLSELRRARELSQQTLAGVMGVSQSEVSKIERRSDVYLSTLRSFIEAMGGELVIIARFPEGEVQVSQFAEVDDMAHVV